MNKSYSPEKVEIVYSNELYCLSAVKESQLKQDIWNEIVQHHEKNMIPIVDVYQVCITRYLDKVYRDPTHFITIKLDGAYGALDSVKINGWVEIANLKEKYEMQASIELKKEIAEEDEKAERYFFDHISNKKWEIDHKQNFLNTENPFNLVIHYTDIGFYKYKVMEEMLMLDITEQINKEGIMYNHNIDKPLFVIIESDIFKEDPFYEAKGDVLSIKIQCIDDWHFKMMKVPKWYKVMKVQGYDDYNE